MSSNVDLVKSIYAAFARGDVPAVLATFDQDISWQTPATLPWSTGDYHGPEGVAEYFGQFMTALTDPAIVTDEFLDAGDQVVVHGEERATSTATGRRFAARFAHSWTLRDGRVTRMRAIIDSATVRDSFTPARVLT
ncbi:MAG: nuclear transport factor 2 family protein [Actinomycetota bacterium]|nr:nuclear transport factor 2 family protein [Actinomycetota bacterium]